MKKIIYAILVCIIIAGAVITYTVGLKADIIYSKNTQLDVYIGKTFEEKDIKEITKEVFPEDRAIIQKVEMFGDMVSITIPEKSEEELKDKLEQLNTKINEKYQVENKVETITVSHNPKTKLSSIIKPYIIPMAITIVVILIYAMIRYKKIGMGKIFVTYILTVGAVEAVYLSVLAITRFPINRLVIPIGLVLYVTTITSLGFINEKKLTEILPKRKNKKEE